MLIVRFAFPFILTWLFLFLFRRACQIRDNEAENAGIRRSCWSSDASMLCYSSNLFLSYSLKCTYFQSWLKIDSDFSILHSDSSYFLLSPRTLRHPSEGTFGFYWWELRERNKKKWTKEGKVRKNRCRLNLKADVAAPAEASIGGKKVLSPRINKPRLMLHKSGIVPFKINSSYLQ